jgi:hypothetical protein
MIGHSGTVPPLHRAAMESRTFLILFKSATLRWMLRAWSRVTAST